MLLTVLFEALGPRHHRRGRLRRRGRDSAAADPRIGRHRRLAAGVAHSLARCRAERPPRPADRIDRTNVGRAWPLLRAGDGRPAPGHGDGRCEHARGDRARAWPAPRPSPAASAETSPWPSSPARHGAITCSAADARLVARADDRWRRLAAAHLPVRRHVRRPLPHAQWRHRLHRAARPPHPGRATRVRRLELWPVVGIRAR